MTHITFFIYSFDSGLEALLALRGWIQALPLIYQILVFAGIVALTVGVLSIVYYIVKGAIVLAIELVKATFNLIKSLVEAIANHARAPPRYRYKKVHPIQPPRPPRPPQAPLPPKAPMPARAAYQDPALPARPIDESTVEVETLHCPECGEAFTPAMVNLMKVDRQVFCEFCGKQLEFVFN
jgi:hypothetical protein